MKCKILYGLVIILFSATWTYAQTTTMSKGRQLVDSLLKFRDADTLSGWTLYFYDIDSTSEPVEFINISSKTQDQMLLVDSVCESVNKDSLYCYVFGVWMDHSIFHMALLHNDTLSVINLNRPLDAIISDIYFYIRPLNLNEKTVRYIFYSAIREHYSNSCAAPRRAYNPLKTPVKKEFAH